MNYVTGGPNGKKLTDLANETSKVPFVWDHGKKPGCANSTVAAPSGSYIKAQRLRPGLQGTEMVVGLAWRLKDTSKRRVNLTGGRDQYGCFFALQGLPPVRVARAVGVVCAIVGVDEVQRILKVFVIAQPDGLAFHPMQLHHVVAYGGVPDEFANHLSTMK